MTKDIILKEINEVPTNKLNELYTYVHSLTLKPNKARRKKILAFAGTFKDMTKKDYKDFLKKIKSERDDLFDRKIKI
jgi:hypothetical protein